MHAPTLRFALPAIVILTIVAIAFVAFMLLTAHHSGAAYYIPGP